MGARTRIAEAFVDQIKTIDGASPFKSKIYASNVEARQRFWDEVNDYPYVCVNPGVETREYQGDSFKWGFLLINIKIYTKGTNCQEDLEHLMEDIEYLMELNHSCLSYGDGQTADIRLLQITTDEGVLHPIGVGEMLFQVRYEIQ